MESHVMLGKMLFCIVKRKCNRIDLPFNSFDLITPFMNTLVIELRLRKWGLGESVAALIPFVLPSFVCLVSIERALMERIFTLQSACLRIDCRECDANLRCGDSTVLSELFLRIFYIPMVLLLEVS